MNTEELNQIIENHRHYLTEDCEGWEKMKANLSGANLIGANLSGANLGEANLSGSNLSEADLRSANLSGAVLSGANLSGANLSGANLSGADLSGANLFGAVLSCANLSNADLGGANLFGANLSGANLSGANLSGADLSGANLSGADLSGAVLSGADLSGANLSCANLSGADLSGAIYDHLTAFLAMTCPEEGSFIGWKKVNGYIVKLRIPEDAKRSSATSRKCRCSHAEVLEIQNLDGSKADIDSVTNASYVKTTYTVGETVHADEWDEDRWNECSHGIHFFITRDEAVNY